MKNFFAIIGGMGTQATESYVHLLNERTPATKDQDYLNYVLFNHATIPDRSTYILDNNQPNPYPELDEDLHQLISLKPDFFVIPCNTAHLWYDELQSQTDIPILHMPRETVADIKEKVPGAKKIGLLGTPGTISDGVYDKEILAAGYELVRPTDDIIQQTAKLIFDDIKERDYVDPKLFHGIVASMIELGADVVILGCTELSLANFREPETEFPVMDSQSVLVDHTLELAMKLQHKTGATNK